MKSNRIKIAGISAAAAAFVGGGAAVAADRLSPEAESDAVVADAAKELGVDAAKLETALKNALGNRVDAAVAAGEITEAQGDELKARIAAGEVPLLGVGRGPGHHVVGHHFADLRAAATYLGLTAVELKMSLREGSTLAEDRRGEGKSVDGFEGRTRSGCESRSRRRRRGRAPHGRAAGGDRGRPARPDRRPCQRRARREALPPRPRLRRPSVRRPSPRWPAARGRRLAAPYCPGPPFPGPGRSNPLFPKGHHALALKASPRTVLATATTCAALLGAGSVAAVTAFVEPHPTTVQQVTVGDEAQPAADSSSSIAAIYKDSHRAVVEITVTAAGDTSQFGGDGGAQQAQGTGFVYDEQGHVVTNAHVVDGAESVEVTFWDGKTYDATVVGTDPSTDLAVSTSTPRRRSSSRSQLADSSAPRGRRRRRRDRQPLRPRADAHHGHRQRPPSLDHGAERLRHRRRDPDGRCDQPRQLWRPAARPGRQGRRRQLPDRERVRRQRRRRLRRPVEHGPAIADA